MPRPSAPASNHAIAQALGLYGAIIIDPADAQDEVKADHRQSRTGPKIWCDLASEETWQAAHSLSHPHHTANNNVEEHGDGELMLIIDVE
jgi:hypothetical protein